MQSNRSAECMLLASQRTSPMPPFCAGGLLEQQAGAGPGVQDAAERAAAPALEGVAAGGAAGGHGQLARAPQGHGRHIAPDQAVSGTSTHQQNLLIRLTMLAFCLAL